MKFTKIMGKDLNNNKALIQKAEEKLSRLFLDLALKYDNKNVGNSNLGGDPLVFTLMQPVEQVATLSIPTAATEGTRFYWNPNFVLKQSPIGLRIIAAHEAFHAIYLHPTRRGARNPKLWNIAVDYIVNGSCMEDLKARGFDPRNMFNQHLGKFMTLPEYADLLKDPFKKRAGFEEELAIQDPNAPKITLPTADEDRDLTEDEIKELERQETRAKFYFADPELPDDMKRPEKIYDYLYALLPKCPDCGRVGIYKRPDKNKGKKNQDQDGQDQGGKKNAKGKSGKDGKDGQKGKGQKSKGQGQGEQDQDQNHDHGDGNPCDCKDHGQNPGDGQSQGDQDGQDGDQGQNPGKGQGQCDHGSCPSCGAGEDGVDVFDFGGLVDDHMDTKENEEKLAKRFSDAIEAAKKMAGSVPAGLEDELGMLTAPKVVWQDVIRARMKKSRDGNQKNDWTRFRTRPLCYGMAVPKRKSYTLNFGCLLDTSGSMSQEDMAFGISQLQSLDERSEGTVVFADCTVYFDQAVKLKRMTADELQSKIKPVGRGGTIWGQFFSEYEQKIGKCDFLIVMSDMYLMDTDVASWVDPGIPVYFLCTSGNTSFVPPFGKLLQLR